MCLDSHVADSKGKKNYKIISFDCLQSLADSQCWKESRGQLSLQCNLFHCRQQCQASKGRHSAKWSLASTDAWTICVDMNRIWQSNKG